MKNTLGNRSDVAGNGTLPRMSGQAGRTILHAEKALLPDGWARDVLIAIADDGRIARVDADCRAGPDATRVGIVLPAPVNLHSHAFQRAMAGMSERRGREQRDTFWTWRQIMFRFLDMLTPDDVEAIAAFVQMEMLEAGYAAVGEFHYLHHQPGGSHYEDVAEMSRRIISASETTGVGLTLLPVLYQFGGCDGRPLGQGQIRFGNDLESFGKLYGEARSALRDLPPDAGIGIAPHSLRATGREGLDLCLALAGDRPVHMHLAEQVAEVEEVTAAHGKRPVEWLLSEYPVDAQWCLIHCTQMQREETTALARTGAVAGLCPITESSLGDGIFDGVAYLEEGGRFGVGSDSNVRISLSEELRTLDYSQRLRDKCRAAVATPQRSTGRVLFDGVVAGGAQAAGRNSGQIAEGCFADLLSLDAGAIDLEGRDEDEILDSWIFAGDDRMVRDVWSAGRHVVAGGRHRHGDAIRERYRSTIRALRQRF